MAKTMFFFTFRYAIPLFLKKAKWQIQPIVLTFQRRYTSSAK